MPATIIIAVLGAAAALLALLVGFRARLTRSREGKILAFVALLILPVLSVWGGFSEQMDRAQSTSFCLSCHVMSDYGRSLYIDDPSYLPAQHFQNNRIPRERACYTCHTSYAMFGGVEAKLKGTRHLWVQYFGTIPKPEDIKLYEPYNNRECLHCHLDARRFEQASAHYKMADLLPKVKAGQLSCTSSGCHDIIHDVASLKVRTRLEGSEVEMQERLEKRIKWASILIGGGLIVQLLCLLRIHPLAFVAFTMVGCPLVGAGIVLYLTSLVSGDSSRP